MQIKLAKFAQHRAEKKELESILRSCVHCGFCNASCPTYQLTGNELDGPRGRIYLLKQLMEGSVVGEITQQHLDRCLHCRSCETSCPSGVEYSRLLDIGQAVVEQKVARSYWQGFKRQFILRVFPYPKRFKLFIQLARCFKFVLPAAEKKKIPRASAKTKSEQIWPQGNHVSKVLMLSGCVQQTLAPQIDLAAAQVLDKLNISMLRASAAGCCGALDYHLSSHEKALQLAKQNIDYCWPYIEEGLEAITMSASGCGLALKEYGRILQYDKDYAEKAKGFSRLVKDLSEIIGDKDLSVFKAYDMQVAYQSPCTLQHGQKLAGQVESILQRIGYKLMPAVNTHLCCGSAGVYSILQPQMSEQLRDNKLTDLNSEQADCIVTANIGCLTHLQAASDNKVKHWIELLVEQGD